MRDTLRITILALVISGLGAGCSGYDRELMGDPEPAAPAQPAPVTVAPQEEPVSQANYDDENALDVGMFEDLQYYGSWHWVDPYGWVWRPIVVSEWQPFLYGHWIWTQYGWMWVSYDPWGWATTHYGYWAVDFALGWVWIPDYTWSPCQCDWTTWDGWISWAPVPPPGVRYRDPWDGDDTPWVSVPARKFKEPEVAHYRTTPKFKSGTSERSLRRSPPDEHEIERVYSKPLRVVDVQLDRTVVGDREFAKVRYPADEEWNILQHQTKTKTNAKWPSRNAGNYKVFPPPPPTGNTDGGSVDSGDQNRTTKTETKVKSESKPKSEPKAEPKKDSSPKKYKEKKEEEKKDDAKKGEKSKKPPF